MFGTRFLTAIVLSSLFSLACHAQDSPTLPEDVLYDSSVGTVLFPHGVHVKLGLGCIACHHQIKAAELKTPHPDYLDSSWINCRTCHGDHAAAVSPYYRCSECHHSEPHGIADETLSAKVVIHRSCWKCHESGTGVEASKGCGHCHMKDDEPAETNNG